jgi:hypothetical protein
MRCRCVCGAAAEPAPAPLAPCPAGAGRVWREAQLRRVLQPRGADALPGAAAVGAGGVREGSGRLHGVQAQVGGAAAGLAGWGGWLAGRLAGGSWGPVLALWWALLVGLHGWGSLPGAAGAACPAPWRLPDPHHATPRTLPPGRSLASTSCPPPTCWTSCPTATARTRSWRTCPSASRCVVGAGWAGARALCWYICQQYARRPPESPAGSPSVPASSITCAPSVPLATLIAAPPSPPPPPPPGHRQAAAGAGAALARRAAPGGPGHGVVRGRRVRALQHPAAAGEQGAARARAVCAECWGAARGGCCCGGGGGGWRPGRQRAAAVCHARTVLVASRLPAPRCPACSPRPPRLPSSRWSRT